MHTEQRLQATPIRQAAAGRRWLLAAAATLTTVAAPLVAAPLTAALEWSRIASSGVVLPAFSSEPTLVNRGAGLDAIEPVSLGGWRLSLRHQDLDRFANPFDIHDASGEPLRLNPLRWHDERITGDDERWGLYDYRGIAGDRWALVGMAGVEWQDDDSGFGLDDPSLSFGLRPMFQLGRGWRMVGEMGYGYTPERYGSEPLRNYRMTLAAEWLPGDRWSDTALRAFVSQRGEESGWSLPGFDDGSASEWQAGVEWQTRW